MLAGAQTTIDALKLPNQQQPDAAPRWARTGQAIALWDYATAEQLQGDGSAPLKVDFRIPPDLFDAYSDRPNAVLRLVYRYNPIPIGPGSSMQVRVNNAFVGSVPLPPGRVAAQKMQVDLPVPVADLRPFSNSLSFDFTFQSLPKGASQQAAPITSMQGAILPGSHLDLRSYSHYAPMPNLEIFANAGFPFTRFADLSETTVVLPPAPTVQEIETFLTLMGHFGRQTGFPALRVTVAGSEAVVQGARADFLIVGTGEDQPAFDKLAGNLPVVLDGGRIHVRDTQGFLSSFLHREWWKKRDESGALTVAGMPDAMVEGFESPFDPGGHRSVVAIHFKDAAAFEPFMDAFLKVQQSSLISGSVAVFDGARFQSFSAGAEVYHVGMLPWWTGLTLWCMQYSWAAAFIVLALCFLLSVWARHWLRIKARARLKRIE
jgi:cellulose synthase (UDP-forming)